MALLILERFVPPRALQLERLGPDASVTALAQVYPGQIVGVVGPPGPAASMASRIAGEALGGHRAVKIGADDKAYYAGPNDADPDAVFGVTTGAASTGENVLIQCGGEMREPTWAWASGGVWLGSSGILTQTIPTTGAIVRIGTAGGPTAINIEPRLIAKL